MAECCLPLYTVSNNYENSIHKVQSPVIVKRLLVVCDNIIYYRYIPHQLDSYVLVFPERSYFPPVKYLCNKRKGICFCTINSLALLMYQKLIINVADI